MFRSTAAVLAFAQVAAAGFVKTWTVEELGAAPVIAVGTVVRVNPDCSVSIRVLRASRPIGLAARLIVLCPQPGRIMPVFQPGETYLLPLARAREDWVLIGEVGHGLTIPVSSLPSIARNPINGKGIVIREIVNTLLRGSYEDIYRIGTYLRFQGGPEFVAEIMVHLEENLHAGDRWWLDLSTALMGSIGLQGRTLQEAMESPRAPLAFKVLGKVPQEGRRPALIRNLLEYSHVHEWGSAMTLVAEFKDHPLVIAGLARNLTVRIPGSLYIAWTLVRNGQTKLLSKALEAAVAAIGRPETIRKDIHAAGDLLIEHGSDEQFEALLDAIRAALKAHDAHRFNQLWQVVFTHKGARSMEIIRAAIHDEHIFSQHMRFCDLAGLQL